MEPKLSKNGKRVWPKSGKPRRTVELCQEEASGIQGKGGNSKLWAFGYATLADLLGLSEMAVRQLVKRARLNPKDLRSVVSFYLTQRRISLPHDLGSVGE